MAFVLASCGFQAQDASTTGSASSREAESQSIGTADEMLRRSAFTSDHYVFYQKDGGNHDLGAVLEYLYNALPHFFGVTKAGGAAGGDASPASENATAASAAPATYTRETPIDEVANDPVFGNRGRLLFPVQRGYNAFAHIRANGTDAEIEVFDGLPHGFGLGTGTAAQGWLDRAVEFWERQL